MAILVLQCRCKDCRHWEIIESEETKQRYLFCKTCEKRFPVTLHIPAHDHLSWTEHRKP